MGRTVLKTVAVLATLGLGLGLTACGDDADDDAGKATTTTAAARGSSAFCDAVVTFNTAVYATDISDDTPADEIKAAGADLGPKAQALVDEAPSGLKARAEKINEAVQPLNDGDAEKFNADATYEGYTRFVDGATSACGFDEVGVTAVDYAFQGVPKTLTAGTMTLALTNKSKDERHEMVIFRKKAGVTKSIEEIVNLPEDQGEDLTEFVGAAQAEPGESGSTLASLTPGQYGVVCFLPVGGGEDGPPHFTRGMLTEFTVN